MLVGRDKSCRSYGPGCISCVTLCLAPDRRGVLPAGGHSEPPNSIPATYGRWHKNAAGTETLPTFAGFIVNEGDERTRPAMQRHSRAA